jgi:hypothetical protein
MHDNAFATKRFTRNAAQQTIKKYCIKFQIFGSKIVVAMQQVAMQQKELRKRQVERYAFPSAANSRNKILAINVAVDPTSCLLLLSYAVLTVTKPARDALYKPVTVWPLSSAVICFQRISCPTLTGAAPGTATQTHFFFAPWPLGNSGRIKLWY